MADTDLNEKFPTLNTRASKPSMSTINGIGTGLYGHRDYDEETRTYVKTYCFCVFFVPVLCFSAWRLADAPGRGWYILGREPLSGVARGWNYLLLLLIIGSVLTGITINIWSNYTSSPQYLQAAALSDADHLRDDGKINQAAHAYLGVVKSRTSHAVRARTELQALFDAHFMTLAADQASRLMQDVLDADTDAGTPNPQRYFDLGVEYINTHLAAAPRDSEKMLAYLARTKDPVLLAALEALRLPLVNALIAKEPTNPRPLSDLALDYEQKGDLAKCEALLAPKSAMLADSEGARILGQIYFQRGDMNAACKLLDPYCATRLAALHTAEKNYEAANQKAADEAVNDLNHNGAPTSWWNQYDKLPTKEAKQAFADQWIVQRMKSNVRLQAVIDALKAAADIVPVALDLGIARLAHAQEITDPAQRKAELVDIEKLFLGMENVAGQSDDYHLFYGQVCYWLGKQEEGKKQFDDLLTARHRTPDVLLEVAARLREVGRVEDAATLGEEAYKALTDQKKKFAAAAFLAVIAEDLDVEIKWLKLSDPNSLWVKRQLDSTLGIRADRDGDRATALTSYTNVAATLDKEPKSASNLNEKGLNHLRLYQLSSDPKWLTLASAELEEALQIQPKDSILLSNDSSILRDQLCIPAFGSTIDFAKIQSIPSLDVLNMLYTTKAECDRLSDRLKKDPTYAKMVQSITRLVTLAPEKDENWMSLFSLYMLVDDDASVKDLLQRYQAHALEPVSAEDAALYAGTKDAEIQKTITVALKKKESLLQQAGLPPATEALLLCQWLESCENADCVGLPVDGDLMLKRVLRAQQLCVCNHTLDAVVDVRYFRCLQTLRKKLPALDQLAVKMRHVWGADAILAWSIEHGGPTRDAILADDDYQAGVQAQIQKRLGFPDSGACVEWALLRPVNPAAAEKLATNLRTNPHLLLTYDFYRLSRQPSGRAQIEQYLHAKVLGKPADCATIMAHYRTRGLPLPAGD